MYSHIISYLFLYFMIPRSTFIVVVFFCCGACVWWRLFADAIQHVLLAARMHDASTNRAFCIIVKGDEMGRLTVNAVGTTILFLQTTYISIVHE